MNKLLYFTAGYCQPCQMFGPIMDKVAQSGIPVQKIDIDSNRELSQKYSIMSVPTVVKVDGQGNALGKSVGIKSQQDIIDFYND